MATKIITTCDRCGRQIEGQFLFDRSTDWGDFDFCDECSTAFYKWEQDLAIDSENQFRKWLDGK